MRFTPKMTRIVFYVLLAAGALFLCVTVSLNSFTSVSERTGIESTWLASLCCIVPIVLGGIALRNESR